VKPKNGSSLAGVSYSEGGREQLRFGQGTTGKGRGSRSETLDIESGGKLGPKPNRFCSGINGQVRLKERLK